ncbi:hypothetical protein ASG01_08830 [Chryseobacterium sp. Leaf180]|uniref:hypothetical protein n=1 Tax=Chryseobacterium sp. Leaf180 TaxID=1736289 RepID=UPI0006F2446E|nr:hypothetical protein [Chryseobacterium sp. Leaf180]KQR93291.1 hypothetical protein ASG01_08830 [Chryseobacterium sp. Leaf180]
MELNFDEIIKICGGVSVVTAALFTVFWQLIQNRLNENWRRKTETKIKVLENNLSEKSNLLSNLIDVQKSNYSSSQERRISSVDKSWTLLGQLKVSVSSAIDFIYNSLTTKEIEELNTSESDSSLFLVPELGRINYEKFYTDAKEFEQIIFKERPFLGVDLALSFTVYARFLGRINHLTQYGIKKGNLTHWKNDKAIVHILQNFLNTSQVDAIIKQEMHTFDIICHMFEEKIMEQINDVISGKTASNHSFEHIKTIKESLSDIDIFKQNK